MPDATPAESAVNKSPIVTGQLKGEVSEVPENPTPKLSLISRLKSHGLRGVRIKEGPSSQPILPDEEESSMAFQARKAETGELLEDETAEEQRKRREQFSERRDTLRLFDFSEHREMRRELGRAQYIAKEFFAGRLERLGLSPDSIKNLRPRYATFRGYDTGYTMWNGIVVVHVDIQDPLASALTTAHELSHASRGTISEYQQGHRGLDMIKGLDRFEYEGSKSEGRFLENLMAVWDTAEIYEEYKKAGLFPEGVKKRTAQLQELLDDKAASSENKYVREAHMLLRQGQQLGIPDTMLEAFAGTNIDSLQQLIPAWRIARLIGQRLPDSTGKNTVEMIKKGREVLERSRYMGTREAHAQIEKIFETDAHIILKDDDWPDMDIIYETFDRAEEKAGLSLN